MTNASIDHDQLFKQLLSTFFIEFMELFFPQIANAIERDSIGFLPQEYFTDLIAGERKIIDLLVQVRLAGHEVGFLVLIEAQATSQTNFPQRLFFYFAKLHQQYLQRIYPIVLFSFDEPYRAQANQYTIEFDDWQVMQFNFRAIQLNRLNWRDYLAQHNPVAAALMAKMQIAVGDRPKVKAECLRLLATLQLDPARTALISGFVDTYLRLNQPEQEIFQAEIGKMNAPEQERIMQIVTSWMEQGIEQGERSLILRQLSCRLGDLPEDVRMQLNQLSITQLETLGEALLDFTQPLDLVTWLSAQT
jgi:predicted transposase/invertase (TIGR01784 family)